MEFIVGTGIAVLALGIALFMVPPPWWPNMPRGLVGFSVASGLSLVAIGSALLAVGACLESLHPVCRTLVIGWNGLKESGWLIPFIVAAIAIPGTLGAFAAPRRPNLDITRQRLKELPPEAVHWIATMLHGARPVGIADDLWQSLERTGLFERDFTGPKGVVADFKPAVKDWIDERNGKRLNRLSALLIAIGVVLVITGIVLYNAPANVETQSATPNPPPSSPDVAIRLVYPSAPALVLVNQSDQVVRQIKWSAAIWNIDDSRTYVNPNAAPDAHDPLPIPVQVFDFLRPKALGGPQLLFDDRLIKPGQRLFGSISVICPDCPRGRTYFVHIVWGEGGWFSEITDRTDGALVIPSRFTKELVQQYYKEGTTIVPTQARNAIQAQ